MYEPQAPRLGLSHSRAMENTTLRLDGLIQCLMSRKLDSVLKPVFPQSSYTKPREMLMKDSRLLCKLGKLQAFAASMPRAVM